ncbi:MAG: hypothetical protein J5631_00545 [Spirochaetaceae bacterium]|nr:hypothetical protein [Spirochaetaceae bacterium]
MNIYENLATQAITSFFNNEPLWKKEILFDFLLEPFSLKLADIMDVITQDNLKETIPDFTIITKDNKRYRYEVKINNSALTASELEKDTRDVYLIRKNYYYESNIPSTNKKLYWEDLFEKIDKFEATKDFARLDLIREYMHEEKHTLLLTPHEVAMLYSPETIIAVYRMKEKVLSLCRNYLNSNESRFEYKRTQDDENGIGFYFNRKGHDEDLFIGLSPSIVLSPSVDEKQKYFSIAKYIEGSGINERWNLFELDKEILAKCSSDEKLQEEFNKNVDEVIKNIK